MKIGIGVDTGGTCTDAVAYDFESGTLLATGKALTTRENLAVGIGNALDLLPRELVRGAVLISLSTTLATNACVENKGCRAKLLIFGLTDEMLERYDAESSFGLKRGSVRCIDTHGSADGFIIDEPDWNAVFEEYGEWLADADAHSVAELYSMQNGAPCEKRAKPLLEERFGLPVICANELSGELNVLERGATALLNARLLPIVREFIDAALSDFKKRGCAAPVMVVRSDGSHMSAESSLDRPVETILSGPAASVLAGRTFSDSADYLVVDIGGTTTDISVVNGGIPAVAEGGIRIGGWKTHVQGVLVDTFALGGDSAVRAEGDFPKLFSRRVMSICSAARRWPEIKDDLQELISRKALGAFPLHEFFYLVKKPSDASRYDENEKKLLRALENGPCSLGMLRETAKIDLYHLNSERLEAEGVIMRCGLTPTDFMHIKGDYSEYDAEASTLAARFLLHALGREDTQENVAALAGEVYGLVSGLLYEKLIGILIGQEHSKQFAGGPGEQMLHLIRDSWKRRDEGKTGFFIHSIGTCATLVGLGAPTHVFLPAVAKALGTGCILPEHAEVANAIGALKADVHAVVKVEISQRLGDTGEMYYIVHSPDGSMKFEDIDNAVAAANAAAEKAALAEIRSRGALGNISINTRTERHTARSRWGSMIKLGGTAVSEATARFEESKFAVSPYA